MSKLFHLTPSIYLLKKREQWTGARPRECKVCHGKTAVLLRGIGVGRNEKLREVTWNG